MSLLTYKDARPWARSIATQVGKGAMPPWHADPKHGQFLNDRRLSDADKAAYDKQAAKLAGMFRENFGKYASEVPEAVRAAGPQS